MRKALSRLLAPLALLASILFVVSLFWVLLEGPYFAWLLTGIAAVVAVLLWTLAWRFRRPTGVLPPVGDYGLREGLLFTRRDLTKKGWYRPLLIRIILVVFGLFVLFVGGVLWSLEEEYGGDPGRQEYVIAWDDQMGHMVLGEGGEVVYEATDSADAEAWVEARRGARNFIYSILALAFGGLLIVAGLAPSPARRATRSTARSKVGVGA